MQEHTLIEFVGVPGGGKSTLALRLQDRLSEDGVALTTYADTFHSGGSGRRKSALMLFDSLAYLLARPFLAWILTRLWFRHGRNTQFSASSRRRKLLKLVALSAGINRNLKTGTVILDQGPLQCLMSWIWAGGQLSDTELDEIAGAVFPLEMRAVIVHVDTDPKTAFQRASDRKSQPSALIQGREPREAGELFELASSTVKEALAVLPSRVSILTHDEAAPNHVADKIVHHCLTMRPTSA